MNSNKSINDFLLKYIDREAAIIVVTIDHDGKIIEGNRHIQKILGEENISGIPFVDMIIDFKSSLDFEKIFQEPERQHLLNIKNRKSLPQTYYFRFFRAEGIMLAVGQQDQLENESMRDAFLQLNNDLSNLTRDLRKKTAALERLDAQKNQFFGMAAHDIRHPLSVIRMYSQFLEDEIAEQLEPIHTQFLTSIKQSAELMEDILNDFLDITVFQTGKLKIEQTCVDMSHWLAPIIDNCSMLASKQNISLNFVAPSESILVEIDTSKISQVVYNLVSNGIKFSSAGDNLTIRLTRDRFSAIFSVIDQGPGISPEDQKKLFIPFVRLANTDMHTEKSSGLGLAIVKKIVDAHGGNVWVESNPGEGATFSVSLPCLPESTQLPGT